MKKVFLLSLVLVFVPLVSYAQVGDVDPNTSQCVELKNNLRLRDRDAQKNSEVSLLQYFLQEKGYLSSEPTGFFGQMTLKAVQAYQRVQGLNPTGFVGELTRGKIKSESGCNGLSYNFQIREYQSGVVLAPGCSSQQGFSPVTGNACNGTTPSAHYPAPTVDLKVNNSDGPLTKSSGYSTFSWNSVNADYCTASGDTYWSGSKPISGSESIWAGNEKTGVTTYRLTCGASSGKVSPSSDNVTINFVSSGTPPVYPAGCTSFQGYSSVNGNACDGSTPPPPVYLPGCTSRQGFSSVNGNACYGSIPPSQTFLPGCTSTQGYSSVNGNACNGTVPPGYPAGCSSLQGYSSVTGNACNVVTPNTTENIVANGGSRTLSVEYVSGKKNTYSAGEKITLKIKGVELFDGSLAEPSEGYHIQAEIREVGSSINNGHGIQSVNATYDYGNKYWVVKMIAPGNSAESYELSSVLYCSNGSLVCGTRHGGDNGQTVAPFMFTVSGSGIFPIKVISPNGGEAYQVGQVNQVPITWAATCGYKSFSADIVRDNGDFYDSYTINPVTAGVCTPNQLAIPYSTMWSIPSDMRPGNYKLVVRGQLLEAGSFVEFGSGFAGISDSFFIVRSGN